MGDDITGVVAHNKTSDYFFIDTVGSKQLIAESAKWSHTVVTDQTEKEDRATEPPRH